MSDIRRVEVNKRVSYDSSPCTVRYIGLVDGTKPGTEWVGVEWDDPSRGKHDGCYNGKRYFTCKSASPTAASFLKASKKSDATRSFIQAVKRKYADDNISHTTQDRPNVISGKVVEEVGFDKIQEQQRRLHELKIIHVDGQQIETPENNNDEPIEALCPSIVELNLSRNLLSFPDVLYIATPQRLTRLKSLKLDGNHFEAPDSYWEDDISTRWTKSSAVTDLYLDDVLLQWKFICNILKLFAAVASLSAATNHLRNLDTPIPVQGLRSLTLDYNDFKTLSDLAVLRHCDSLETLRLKGNQIASIAPQPYVLSSTQKFGGKLRYVDLSYNAIASWKFIDDLDYCFPGLTGLRLAHNSVYDTKDIDSGGSADAGYMLTVARFAKLESLNFSNIAAADRSNAEMFYLSRIARAIAAVSESDAKLVIDQHKRYSELCEQYGEPAIVRTNENAVNPGSLEARLIKFKFHLSASGKEPNEVEFSREIPKSFDTYRVKGIVGKVFGVAPLKVRLIWETGEWDPVAGYEDDESDDEDEEKSEMLEKDLTANKGRWTKREVEIKESTRLIGNCVDGLEATVRVEVRC